MSESVSRATRPTRQNESAAQASLWAAALDALREQIAVLDHRGVILWVNRIWRESAGSRGLQVPAYAVGTNYLTTCDEAPGPHSAEAAAAARGIRSVIAAESESFSLEYPCAGDGEDRWFLLRVTAMRGARPAAALVAHEDITERRSAQHKLVVGQAELESRVRERTAALTQSEEHHRHIIESLPGGVINVASDGSFLFANAEALRFLGMSLDTLTERLVPDFAGETIREDGSDCPISEYPASRCITSGRPQPPMTIGVRRPDGDLVWAVFTAVPVACPIHPGRTAAIVTFLNITERKRAEDALRESEERYRLLFERNPQPMWVYDVRTLEFLAVNDAAVKHYQYTRAEFRRMTLRDLHPPEDLFALEVLLCTRVEHLLETTWRHRVRGGKLIDVQITAHGLLFEGREANLILAQDVTVKRRAEEALRQAHEELEVRVRERTAELAMVNQSLREEINERRRTEELLRESEFQFRQMAENLGEVVWILEVRPERLLYISPAYEVIFGRKVAEMYENPRSFVHSVFAEDLPRVIDSLVTRFREPCNTVYRVHDQEGGLRWVRSRTFPIRDAGGRIYRITGIVEDISDIKRSEEELTRLQHEVLKISERERRAIGQDLHDGLGQQLTGIAFLSKSLHQRLSQKVAQAALPTTDEAVEAGEIADLVQEAIGKTRALARGLHPVEQAARGLMAALAELAAHVESVFRIPCTFECETPVLVDDNAAATHLYRIAQEAVNNAVKYASARQIRISMLCDGATMTLTVEDDGIGIPDGADLGTGLGLRIMQYRAKMVGGSLKIGRGERGGTVVACVVDAGCSAPGAGCQE